MQFNGMKENSLLHNDVPPKKQPSSLKEDLDSSETKITCESSQSTIDSDKEAADKKQAINISECQKPISAVQHNGTSQDKDLIRSLCNKAVDNKKVKKIIILVTIALLAIATVVIFSPRISDFIQAKKAEQQRKEMISQCLKEAEGYALNGKYAEAVNEIEECLLQYGSSDKLNLKLEEYNDCLTRQAIDNLIQLSKEKAESGDYKAAIELLDSAAEKYGDEDHLKALRENYAESYSPVIINEIQNLVDRAEYVQAKQLLSDAVKILGNTAKINELKEKIEKYEVTPLNELTPINGGFAWNEGTAQDPFGNNYYDVCNFFIFHGIYCSTKNSESTEYKLAGAYDTLFFQISPYKDFGEEAESYIQIYADNVLIFTSPRIQRKSGLQKVTLDIHNAEYLKIVINKGDYGCLLLSNVVVSKSPEYVKNFDSNIVSLSTLEALNGGFSWNDSYPEDPYGSDYTHSCNYVIYHGRYCSTAELAFSEYKLLGEYEELSFKIAPCKDYATDAQTFIQVYVDEVIKYTSPLITAKGGVYDAKVDVKGAEYLKIVIDKDEHGCVLLSDIILKKAENPLISPDKTVEYLSTLSQLNGGNFKWNNEFPQNTTKDDYSLARNYFVFHGDYCSGSYTAKAEYYLDGKYKTFSLEFAPYSDFAHKAKSSVIIYADEKKIFSASINQKSKKASTGELNISGASYLKIIIEKGNDGCVIISDAKLSK